MTSLPPSDLPKGTALGVTEMQAALDASRLRERQLHMVVDALPVLVSFVDKNERYAFVNKAYDQWFGTPSEMLVGKTLREVVGDAAYAILSPHVRRALSGERFTFEQREVPYSLGGTRDVRVEYVPRYDDAGEVEGYVALLQDVTEQNRAEEVLRRQAQFEQQLIGIVSHDLRNPISVISMAAATLLRRQDVQDGQRVTLGRIVASADRAARMITELLDFTQARLGGGLPMQPAELDLHELARDVVEEVRVSSPDCIIEVNHVGDGRALLDGDRIAQLLTNLVGNALCYGDRSAAVQVSTRGDASAVELSVSNQGEPIPSEMTRRLFEPLVRGTSAQSAKRNVGLGLYIVKQIVVAHGGTIEVTSSPAHGTCFTARFPRQAAR